MTREGSTGRSLVCAAVSTLALLLIGATGCSSDESGGSTPSSADGGAGGSSGVPSPAAPPGNATGGCATPPGGGLADVSRPTTVIGDGTPASCTSAAVVAAVAKAGVITFDCGSAPITIEVPELRLFNDAGAAKNGDLTIDGGGKVTLSGGGKNRILYQNTCEQELHWTTSHCNNQEHPKLVLQNLTLASGRAIASSGVLGGGAVYVQGGQLALVNTTFLGNVVETLGSDYAGGAVYAVQMFAPVFVSGSTFGAAGNGNQAASGGALGSIGVSWTIVNSRFEGNTATGTGQSSGQGGNGGAIYNDGNTYTLSLCGTEIRDNKANELGGAIFYVSNNLTGAVLLDRVTSRANTTGKDVQGELHKGIYAEVTDKAGKTGITVKSSTIE
ncbi:MAG: hypothetical protein U0270_37905 [Labilithrix sp.]